MTEPITSVTPQPGTSPSLADELWTSAEVANSYRRQQQLEQAIRQFDEVIERAGEEGLDDILVYSYARRGAAKMAQGFYTRKDEPSGSTQNGAIEDLKQATELDRDDGWAWAQLGEAHRLYAKARYRFPYELAASTQIDNPDDSTFNYHIEEALNAFEKADTLYPAAAAWVKAHWAATYFLSVWRAARSEGARLPRFTRASAAGATLEPVDLRDPQACLNAALVKFEQAVELNPGYAWAKRFIGYIATMQRDYKAAMQKLGEAFLDDPTGQLFMLRSSSLLFLYAATQASDADEKKEFFLRALNTSQIVLNQHNSEDYAATYVQARALDGLGYASARQVCGEARDRLLNTIARITGLAMRLHQAAGHDVEDFPSLLGRYLETLDRDDEIVMIRNHDESIDEDETRTVQNLVRNP